MQLSIGNRTYNNVHEFDLVFDTEETCRVEMHEEVLSSDATNVKLHVPQIWQKSISKFNISLSLPTKTKNDETKEVPEKRHRNQGKNSKSTRKRRINKKIQSDDDEESKENEAKAETYHVEKDRVKLRTDFVPFSHTLEKRKDYLYFDEFGRIIDFDEDLVVYAVTPEGEVLSRYSFGMLAYIDDIDDGDEQTKYAPGCPVRFYMENDNVMIELQWLKTQDEYFNNFEPSFSSDEGILYSSEKSALPITSFCANVSHVSVVMREHFMQPYSVTLRELLRNSPDPPFLLTGGTVLEALELKYVKSDWVWRTRLGLIVWREFIYPSLDFGGKPRLDLVEDLLNARSFRSGPRQSKDQCHVCNKKNICQHFVEYDDISIDVGFFCLHHMKYIWDIGDCLRSFRIKTCEKDSVQSFLNQLKTLQQNFIEKQHEFPDTHNS